MSTVLTSTVALALKETLEEIITDDPGGAQKRVMFTKWCKEQSMSDAYEDDVEYAGPGYASEVSEAAPIPLGSITEGATTRYIARKFGLKLAVSEPVQFCKKQGGGFSPPPLSIFKIANYRVSAIKSPICVVLYPILPAARLLTLSRTTLITAVSMALPAVVSPRKSSIIWPAQIAASGLA